MNEPDFNETLLKEIFPNDLKNGMFWLDRFSDYSEEYSQEKGVYAIFVKEQYKEELLKQFEQDCINYTKERFSYIKNNLFYLGETKGESRNFKKRVITGHRKGGNTTACRHLLYFINHNYKTRKKLFAENKKDFLSNISPFKWEEWFDKYFYIKVFPLRKTSSIKFLEAYLIYIFQPPLNIDGCDKKIIKEKEDNDDSSSN